MHGNAPSGPFAGPTAAAPSRRHSSHRLPGGMPGFCPVPRRPCPAPEGSLPTPEGFPPTHHGVPHPNNPSRTPRTAPSVARRVRRPRPFSGPWTGAGPPSGRVPGESPRVLRPRPSAPKARVSSPGGPDPGLSPLFLTLPGWDELPRGPPTPRDILWERATVWQRVGAHRNANAPFWLGKPRTGERNAAEGLFQ